MIELVWILLLLFVLVGLIFMAPRLGGRSSIDRSMMRQRWQEIEAMVAGGGQTARYAVIEADKLLDHALKGRGFRGETMGERLKSARTNFKYNNDVWSAHKLRNSLVHEANHTMNTREIKRAVGSFHQALKDLGAL